MNGNGHISVIAALALVLIMASCQKKNETHTDQEVFYLGDLIDIQIEYLTLNSSGIRKVTRLGDYEEIAEIYPDSLEWTKELNILKDADISKPGLRPFYDFGSFETPLYRVDHYVLKDTGKSNTLYQKVYRDKVSGNPLRVVTGQYVRNPIYHSERMIELVFITRGEHTVIDSIMVRGYQKMITRDTAFYSLTARIIP